MAFCRYMKMITLPKLRDSLRDLRYEVKVPAGRRRARAGADRAHGRDRLAHLGGIADIRRIRRRGASLRACWGSLRGSSLALVLAGSAVLKLASPASSRAALATFEIHGERTALGRLGPPDRGRARPGDRGRRRERRRGLARGRVPGAVRRGAGRRDPARAGRRALRVLRLALDGRLDLGGCGTSCSPPASRCCPSLPSGASRPRSGSALGLVVALLALRRPRRRRPRAGARGRDAAAAPRAAVGARDPATRAPSSAGRSALDRSLRRAAATRLALAVFTSEGCRRLPRARAGDRQRWPTTRRWRRGLRRGRRRGRLEELRDPRQPVRAGDRRRRHRARQGDLQQPGAARERAGNGGARRRANRGRRCS